jgi:hypothetical protein
MQVINLDLPKKSLKKSFQLMTIKFELCLEIPLKAFHWKDYINKNIVKIINLLLKKEFTGQEIA